MKTKKPEKIKFTFKENKATGRYRSFETESHEIKIKKQVVGSINELAGKAWNNTPDEDVGKFVIRLAIKKEKTPEVPCDFKWITLKKRFNTATEAKEMLQAVADKIIEKYDLHHFDKD